MTIPFNLFNLLRALASGWRVTIASDGLYGLCKNNFGMIMLSAAYIVCFKKKSKNSKNWKIQKRSKKIPKLLEMGFAQFDPNFWDFPGIILGLPQENPNFPQYFGVTPDLPHISGVTPKKTQFTPKKI